MPDTTIFRNPTEIEKRNFINLLDQQEGAWVAFKKRLNSAIQQHTKERKPFCARCARFDWQDQARQHSSEIERLSPEEATNLHFENIDLQQYSNPERFEQTNDRDAMEPTTVITAGGITRQIKTGIHRDYKCKKRGCGISIYIPNEELANTQTRQSK